MQALRRRILKNPFQKIVSTVDISKPYLRAVSSSFSSGKRTGDDEWNDAWEVAWLPEDLNPSKLSPWETGGELPIPVSASPPVTKAFEEEVNENRESKKEQNQVKEKENGSGSERSSLYSLENIKKDYRLKKQKIHAGLWTNEIEKVQEAKLGGSAGVGGGDDIDRLLDSASEIFDTKNDDLNDSKKTCSSQFENKPDGWEATSKVQDGNVWEMSQREEDILVQEFDRRLAFNKFQITSFLRTHIFSRRRPIDGWKYMIEELGPNAKRKEKGRVSRLPSLSDASTQPFKEESDGTAFSSRTPAPRRAPVRSPRARTGPRKR